MSLQSLFGSLISARSRRCQGAIVGLRHHVDEVGLGPGGHMTNLINLAHAGIERGHLSAGSTPAWAGAEQVTSRQPGAEGVYRRRRSLAKWSLSSSASRRFAGGALNAWPLRYAVFYSSPSFVIFVVHRVFHVIQAALPSPSKRRSFPRLGSPSRSPRWTN